MKLKLSLLVAVLVASGGIFVVTAADKKAEKKPYPLTKCVVTDEALGSMGKPYVHTHEGREVQFCCKGCIKDFNKDPKKYIGKIDAAEKAKK